MKVGRRLSPSGSGANDVSRRTWLSKAILIGMLAALALPVFSSPQSASAQQAPADWAPPRTVYIPETGQSIDGYFLDVWRAWGGAVSFGYPITPELIENDRIVQYYQYARFEYWPDDPNGDVVKFGEIGRDLKPVTVFRTIPSLPGATVESSLTQELSLELRAWIPLGEKASMKQNTDTWRFVPETGHSVQFGFKDWWEATGEATYLGNPLTEEYILDGVTYQVFERGQLAWTSESGVWLVPVGEVLAERFQLDTVPRGQGNLPIYDEALWIPPPPPKPEPIVATGEKWIQVNLSTQYLIAWQGDTPIAETYVSTGRPGFDTPPGTYRILYHVRVQDMEGVIGGEYYNVPDVPWVMYFTGVGHAFHGTYWHNNFGAVMSHGCVNMPVAFAQFLYEWAPAGTRVEIHY